MIVSIKGQIIEKKPDSVIININGLGYLCYISSNTYTELPQKNQKVFLETYYNVTDHSQELYAFSDITSLTSKSSLVCLILPLVPGNLVEYTDSPNSESISGITIL